MENLTTKDINIVLKNRCSRIAIKIIGANSPFLRGKFTGHACRHFTLLNKEHPNSCTDEEIELFIQSLIHFRNKELDFLVNIFLLSAATVLCLYLFANLWNLS